MVVSARSRRNVNIPIYAPRATYFSTPAHQGFVNAALRDSSNGKFETSSSWPLIYTAAKTHRVAVISASNIKQALYVWSPGRFLVKRGYLRYESASLTWFLSWYVCVAGRGVAI